MPPAFPPSQAPRGVEHSCISWPKKHHSIAWLWCTSPSSDHKALTPPRLSRMSVVSCHLSNEEKLGGLIGILLGMKYYSSYVGIMKKIRIPIKQQEFTGK